METNKESQSEKDKRAQNEKSAQNKKPIVKTTDAEGSTTPVDLDKADFSSRPHGRTTSSLGPDHEPGTV
ncbi:MAG: hypothetical protein WBJ10_15685 [Daejeonella sp.]|uniref:hypothetical protein n=1 Tax=Daejeonella sp. TaxID=2805397 RepID=UPI003C72D3DD